MYDNIGKKLKSLAKWVFIISAILDVICGVFLLLLGKYLSGVLVLVLGPVFDWLLTWKLYGFGELVDKACDIEANTRELLNCYGKLIDKVCDIEYNTRASKLATKTIVKPVPKLTKDTDRKTNVGQNEILDDVWICSKCNVKNTINRNDCWNCGNPKE